MQKNQNIKLSGWVKALSDWSGDSSAGGRRFHVAGPLTAKLRCPVAVRARGTSRVPVAADRRCWRPEMAVAGTQRLLRWAGATPWTHIQTVKTVLKTTRWLTSSQCRSSSVYKATSTLLSLVVYVHDSMYCIVGGRIWMQQWVIWATFIRLETI